MKYFVLLSVSFLFFSLSISAQGVKVETVNVFEKVAGEDSLGIISASVYQDSRLEELANRYATGNKEKPGIRGYRIQIFSGSGNYARSEANKTMAEFRKDFPDVECTKVYIEPYWRVRVGNFRSKAEGFETFKLVSEKYPQCYFVIDKEMDYPKLPEPKD